MWAPESAQTLSWLHHLLPTGPWASYLTLATLQFPHLSKENNRAADIHRREPGRCKSALNVSHNINFMCTIYIIILLLGRSSTKK